MVRIRVVGQSEEEDDEDDDGDGNGDDDTVDNDGLDSGDDVGRDDEGVGWLLWTGVAGFGGGGVRDGGAVRVLLESVGLGGLCGTLSAFLLLWVRGREPTEGCLRDSLCGLVTDMGVNGLYASRTGLYALKNTLRATESDITFSVCSIQTRRATVNDKKGVFSRGDVIVEESRRRFQKSGSWFRKGTRNTNQII
jgi:hypothetical protein